jgi:hypothetical protein
MVELSTKVLLVATAGALAVALSTSKCHTPPVPPDGPPPPPSPAETIAAELEAIPGCLAALDVAPDGGIVDGGVVTAVAKQIARGYPSWIMCLAQGGTVHACGVPCDGGAH